MRKRVLLATTALVGVAIGAYAQTVGTGTIDGLQYETLTSPDGCSAASPCQIIEYLHYLGGESQTPNDLQKYFNTTAFWATNPHTIIVAPMVNGSSATNNWGGVQDGMSPNMQAAINLVKQTEMTVATNPNTVVVTGGSMGGIGTEAAMVEAGPKGTVDPGVFSAGLAYDGALYNSDAQAATSALCGVSFTMVHGTADTTVPYQYDQALAGQLSGCQGFNFVPVSGATHGTWNNGSWGGYEAGTLIDQTLATASQSGGTAAPVAIAKASSSQAPSSSTQAETAVSMPATAQNDPTPGNGSATDCSGNVWSVNATNKILENGIAVVGGGDTSNLVIVGCTVYGKSNGENGSSTNWFTMNSADPTNSDGWAVSMAPTPAEAGVPTETATTSAAPLVVATPSTANTACAVSGDPSGGFHVAGGRILGPDGKDWIGRGINLYDSQLDQGAAMVAMFSGINFFRVSVGHDGYHDPSYYQSFISQMTAQGRVVELEHHPDGGGGQDPAYTGSALAAENAWYASVGKAFAGNPYVWFGTFNEPGTQGGSVSAWELETYNAIRNAGNNSLILLEIVGWPGAWNNSMNPADFSGMHNTVWDAHFYGWIPRYSTDQATVDKALADEIAQVQQIPSADGTMPVMVAEYGNSTAGDAIDPNGEQSVSAVVSAGGSGKVGSAAWAWLPGGNSDHLQNGGALTSPYGEQVALYINTDVIPPTKCQLDAAAQQGIANVTAALATTTP